MQPAHIEFGRVLLDCRASPFYHDFLATYDPLTWCGRENDFLALSAIWRKTQSSLWSFTKPIACMKAKTVVGPTNFHPRFFRSFESAIALAHVVCD